MTCLKHASHRDFTARYSGWRVCTTGFTCQPSIGNIIEPERECSRRAAQIIYSNRHVTLRKLPQAHHRSFRLCYINRVAMAGRSPHTHEWSCVVPNKISRGFQRRCDRQYNKESSEESAKPETRAGATTGWVSRRFITACEGVRRHDAAVAAAAQTIVRDNQQLAHIELNLCHCCRCSWRP